MSLRIGVLAEDRTDTDALVTILRRIVPREVGIIPRAPTSGGCSALRRKARGYIRELATRGCTVVILVHDLDRSPANAELNNEDKLREKLEKIACPGSITSFYCIPVEELEAWFWSDQGIIDRIGRGKHGKASSRPHTIRKPKEELMRRSRRAGRRPVYSPNMNAELAQELDLELCAERCRSFGELLTFVKSQVSSQVTSRKP